MPTERILSVCGGPSTSYKLLGRGREPPADTDTSVLHRFFDAKVAGVCACTASAPAPQFSSRPVGCELRVFSPVTPYDAAAMVRALPDSVLQIRSLRGC